MLPSIRPNAGIANGGNFNMLENMDDNIQVIDKNITQANINADDVIAPINVRRRN